MKGRWTTLFLMAMESFIMEEKSSIADLSNSVNTVDMGLSTT